MYKYITDPNTGSQILTKSVSGRKILNNYILLMRGAPALLPASPALRAHQRPARAAWR